MNGAWVIARLELLRMTRERSLLFFALLLPVVITVVIGISVFSDETSFTIGVVNEDGGPLSARLADGLDATPAAEIRRYDDVADVRAAVRRGTVHAGLVVPSDYERDLRDGRTATVTLIADPVEGDAPVIRAAVAGAVEEQSSRVTATRFATERSDVGEVEAAAIADRIIGSQPPIETRTVDVGGDEERAAESQFDYTAPSNLVLFVFINSLAIGAAIVEGRRLGITRRVLSTPTAVRAVVAGIGASRVIFALTQASILIVLGALLFGVDWGDPVAAAALVLLFALVSTGAGLLVGATVRNGEQAQAIGIPAAIALGMLGGCMWPLFIVPDAMRIAGHVTPHAWAMDAWIDLVYDGGDLASVAVELAVLAGFAAVLCTAAVVALTRSVQRP